MKNAFSSLCTLSHPQFHSSSNISGQLVPFFFFTSHSSGTQNVAHSSFLVKDSLLGNVFSTWAAARQGSTGHPWILHDELASREQQDPALAPLLPRGSENPTQFTCFGCNQHLSGTRWPPSDLRAKDALNFGRETEKKGLGEGKCVYKNVMGEKITRMNQQYQRNVDP